MSDIRFNYYVIAKILGIITLISGLFMLPALLCAVYYHEQEMIRGLSLSAVITILAGGFVAFALKPLRVNLRMREGYLVVTLAWLVASLFGSLPYVLSGTTDFITGFFESTAGFTTTGCTAAVAALPKSLFLWKSLSQWLGGMGILIFVVSILPALGINGHLIARVETPGPVLEKMTMKISDSAKILYSMYIAFSLLEFVLLNLNPGIKPYDALINTLGSISTGGLFSMPEHLSPGDSLYLEWVISIFTILSSLNFVLYYYALRRHWDAIRRDVEFKAFFCILIGGTLICTLGLFFIGDYPTFGGALQESFFQVTGVLTTSGYATADYTAWPTICKMVLLTSMFIGGCAASTCGSVKVIRVLVLCKLILRGFDKRIHPRSVVAVKIGGKPVSAPMVSAITVFIFTYMMMFLLSAIILSLQGLDMETSITAAASLLSNTGISLGKVGAMGNYSLFGGPMKLYLCLIMIIGRLELFAVISLFTRTFWRRDH